MQTAEGFFIVPGTFWNQRGLLAGGVEVDEEDAGVILEVGVGGEDGAMQSEGDGADEDVHEGDDHSFSAAGVPNGSGCCAIAALRSLHKRRSVQAE